MAIDNTGNAPLASPQNGITSDPSTWPGGDRIWDICRAIAIAEGANIAGSNPDRLNNPGDISDGYAKFGGEWHSGSSVTKFPDKVTGWAWLYNKINASVNGNSVVYPASLSISQFARKYAGDWQNWQANVGRELQVADVTKTSFADYVNGGA